MHLFGGGNKRQDVLAKALTKGVYFADLEEGEDLELLWEAEYDVSLDVSLEGKCWNGHGDGSGGWDDSRTMLKQEGVRCSPYKRTLSC